MKNNTLLVNELMKRVVKLEKKRTVRWFEVVIFCFGIIITAEVLFLIDLVSEMNNRQMLDLFWGAGDGAWEIIRYEMPWEKFEKSLAVLFLLFVLLIYFLIKISIRKRKWKQIKEFENKSETF